MKILDPAEQERLFRYKVEFKQVEYLLGRVLLKKVLADSLRVGLDRIFLDANHYGKLYLKEAPKVSGLNLHFNLSHSVRMIAAGFLLGEELGLDVEKTRPDLVEIGTHFFSEEESAYILSHDGVSAQNQATCKIWTLKEAYIKAQGVGISSEILREKTILGYPGWFFATFSPEPDYFMSVAVQKKGETEPKVSIRRLQLEEIEI